MFSCEFCPKSYTRKNDLKRHGDCHRQDIICEKCNTSFRTTRSLKRHKKEHYTQNGTIDNANVQSTSYGDNLKSQEYKEKWSVDPFKNITVVKTAFKSRIVTYRIHSTHFTSDVRHYLLCIKEKVIPLLETKLKEHVAIKVNVELFGNYILVSKDKEDVKSFNTRNEDILQGSDLDQVYENFCTVLTTKASEFEQRDSGWALQKILFLEVNINKYNPLRASSYLPLPAEIQRRKAVLNIKNNDQKCFLWCVLAALHPVDRKNNANQVIHYKPFENELNFNGIDFPVKLSDIQKFENLNNISVNVYGVEQGVKDGINFTEIVGPLHFRSSLRSRHVNLLLITNNQTNCHYTLIRSLSRLVSSQINKTKYSKNLCDGCLVNFTSVEKLKIHQMNDCQHISVKLPGVGLRRDKFGNDVPENKLKFENFEKKIKVPFVIYADFETILKPIETGIEEKNYTEPFTHSTHKLEAYSFAYYIKCSYNDSLSKLKLYRGLDAPKKFVEYLESDCKNIYFNHLKPIVPMLALTQQEVEKISSVKNCHICEKPFNDLDIRVKDHNHQTGKFQGMAHSLCNLNYKTPTFIPVFFHNMSSFDAHLFICDIASDNAKLEVIAENKEKYISFSKLLLVDKIKNAKGDEKQVIFKIRFLDSLRFLPNSLDTLSRNLTDEQCQEISKYFPEKNKFDLIRQKGVFPYNYVDSFSKLDEAKLPPLQSFYNKLKDEDISQNDYERAVDVWNLFKCKSLGEYSDIYLKSDVLLLTDVFENFRDICMSTYGLDSAQMYTAPSLSWIALQKISNKEIDLLTDVDMLHFFKRGIRGGLSQCSVRKSVANNQYLFDYDQSKESSFIMYLDATNLYGAAMSNYLPTGNFKWLTQQEILYLDYMNIPSTNNVGYVMEVDLEYPRNLHDLHNHLPFCPESIVFPNSCAKIKKLISNFANKNLYVIHFINLQQCLKHGLKLTKIHRVLSFDQSPWLKTYIDLNTEMRNKAKNKFEKDFYKLMNNAIFGKTIENVEKRTDVKLVTHWENIGKRVGAESLIAKPNFKDCTIFRDNFVAIQMEKTKVVYDKPIYIGFCVLELSKSIMYSFYYDFIKPKYGQNVKLLYMDTDSFILSIITKDFYNDMKMHLDKFDTSNYAQINQFNMPITPPVLGKMKDEFKGVVIKEFYGTGAKAYCINLGDDIEKRAKGISKYVTDKNILLNDYKQAVETEHLKIFKQVSAIRTRKHEMYLELQNKVALSYSDDKRYLIPGSADTLAWGHYKITT